VTPFEAFWLVFCLAMIAMGMAAKSLDRKESPPCPRCLWPQGGVLPCLCPEGTEGRYEGRKS